MKLKIFEWIIWLEKQEKLNNWIALLLVFLLLCYSLALLAKDWLFD